MTQVFTWTVTETITKEVEKSATISDIYGMDLQFIRIPEGFITDSFRFVKSDDAYWLNSIDPSEAIKVRGDNFSELKEPRIILKKQPSYRLKKGKQPRLPVIGDLIVNREKNENSFGWTDTMMEVKFDFSEDKHFVFEKVEE